MTSLAEAIHQKFLEVNSVPDTNGKIIIVAPKVDPQNGIPHVLVISSRSVVKAGNPAYLEKILAKVVELDISHNSIDSLQEISIIFQNAPKLQFLNIGFNALSSSSIPKNPLDFPDIDILKTLILLGTCAPWDVVWFFLCHAKNLNELHLSLNKYTLVELAAQERNDVSSSLNGNNARQFGQVVKLFFDNNPVCSWEEISKLGIAFPNLHHLSLTDSPINSITSNGGENFKNLKTLWLSNSRIAKLEDLENLRYFPILDDLRINGIPYLEGLNEEVRRQHFIAILPNIVTLNRGRTIGAEERITAERNFIRYYMDQSDPPKRFHQLKNIHGEVPKLVDLSLKPPTKVNVLIRYEDKEICRMDVHLKKTVKELKDILEPIIGVAATNMDLYYLDTIGFDMGKEHMRYPNKQLYTYHMREDGVEILVYRKGTVVCGSTVIYTKP